MKSVGRAMERRFHVYRFDRPISKDDKQLGEKLRAEASAILAWMIEGAHLYYQIGLKRSPACETATTEYLLGTDHIGQWLADCAEVGPEDFRVRQSSAYESLRSYMEEKGRRFIPDMETLVRYLAERGVGKKRAVAAKGEAPSHTFIGLRLLRGANEPLAPGSREF